MNKLYTLKTIYKYNLISFSGSIIFTQDDCDILFRNKCLCLTRLVIIMSDIWCGGLTCSNVQLDDIPEVYLNLGYLDCRN